MTNKNGDWLQKMAEEFAGTSKVTTDEGRSFIELVDGPLKIYGNRSFQYGARALAKELRARLKHDEIGPYVGELLTEYLGEDSQP